MLDNTFAGVGVVFCAGTEGYLFKCSESQVLTGKQLNQTLRECYKMYFVKSKVFVADKIKGFVTKVGKAPTTSTSKCTLLELLVYC